MTKEAMLNPLRCHFRAVLKGAFTSPWAGFTIPHVTADGSYMNQFCLRSMFADLSGRYYGLACTIRYGSLTCLEHI